MKLMEFNPDVVPANTRSHHPKIGFHTSGLITLNKEAQELLKLKESDAVKLYQSDEDAADWFIAKAKGGFALRKTSPNQNIVAFNCKYIKDKIFESVETERTSGSIRIKADALVKVDGNVNAYPIMTSELNKHTS